MKLKTVFILIGLIAILFFLFMPAHAIFGLEKMFKGIVSAEVSAVRQDIAGDINGVRADIKGDANGLKLDIAKLADIQLRMDAKLTNTMTGIAGANNKITRMSAGRDMTTTTTNTNDTALMKSIISSMGAVITGLLWYIRILSKQRAKVESRLMDFMSQQESGQAKYIEMIEKIALRTINGVLADKEKSGEAKNV